MTPCLRWNRWMYTRSARRSCCARCWTPPLTKPTAGLFLTNLFCAKDGQDRAYQAAHWSRWLEVIGNQLGAVHVKDCRIGADGSKTLLPLGAGDMDYSAIRAFLANRAPAAPLLRDEVILPADTADVRYLRRMTDTV